MLCGILASFATITPVFADDSTRENKAEKADKTDKVEDKTEETELQDMSDPLAVFTVGGIGYSDRGFNVKFGQTYDTGKEDTLAVNLLEIQGFLGESVGFSQTMEPNNSIDTVRLRNFEVNTTNGRGTQIDFNYNVASENLNVSYSFIQALPKIGPVQFYPLMGIGVSIQNNAIDRIDNDVPVIDNGYSTQGVFAVIGVYSRIDIVDGIWFNYNPMYTTTLSGADYYKDNGFGLNNSDILLHEVSLSFQVNPRSTVRYFANFSDEVNYKDGQHAIEFNYQF